MKRGSAAPVAKFTGAVLIGAICLPGLTGCVTPVSEQLSALDKAAVCCTSMRELKYVPLAMVDEKEVTLGAESAAFAFDTGKSFFAAYRLPQWSAPYQIRAEAQGGNVRAGLFSPSAIMLDRDFRITRQFNVAQSTANTRPGIVHVFVNEPNRDEEYLILFTAKLASAEGFNTLIANPKTVMIGAAPLHMGATESRVSLRYSPTGVLQLKVSPYQPLRAGQGSKAD